MADVPVIFSSQQFFPSAAAIAAQSAAPNTLGAPDDPKMLNLCAKLKDTSAAAPTFFFVAYDGTTLSFTPWAWDATAKLWFPLTNTGAAIAAVPANPGKLASIRLDYAFVYMQLTANTLVTKAAWFWG